MASPDGNRGINRFVPCLTACVTLGLGYILGAASADRPAPIAPVPTDALGEPVSVAPVEVPAIVRDRKPDDRARQPEPDEAPRRSPVGSPAPPSASVTPLGSPLVPADLALFLRAERHAAADDSLAALEEFTRGVATAEEFDRDLDLEFTLEFREQSRLEFVRDILDALRRAGIEKQDDLEHAIERLVALAVRVAGDTRGFHHLVLELRIAHHPLAEEHLLQGLPQLGWSDARELLHKLQHRDPGRHDRLLAAWIANNPTRSAWAERYRALLEPDALEKDLTAARSGNLRHVRATIGRLVEAARIDDARALLEDVARQLDTGDLIQAIEDLPQGAQETLQLDLLDPTAIARWLREETDPGSLPDDLAPVWQERFAAQRWSEWAQRPAAELDFHDVARMAKWQAAHLTPSPLTRSLLERSSFFRADASVDTLLSSDAAEHIVLAFRLGHRDLAIAWARRQLDAFRARGHVDDVAETQRRLTRMRHGVDPLID